jgi:hypothetical protein
VTSRGRWWQVRGEGQQARSEVDLLRTEPASRGLGDREGIMIVVGVMADEHYSLDQSQAAPSLRPYRKRSEFLTFFLRD